MNNPQTQPNMHLLKGVQILLVEDCPDQVRIYLQFLQQAGAEVTLECQGQSAVEHINSTPSQIDAIVMDFKMPEMDGLTATEELRKIGFSGAIIAITAHTSCDLREAWHIAGCNAYLEKPLKKQVLIETIQQSLMIGEESV